MTKLIDGDSHPLLAYRPLTALREQLEFGIYLVEEDDGDMYVLISFDPDEPRTLHTITGGELSRKIYVSEHRRFRIVRPLNLTTEGTEQHE